MAIETRPPSFAETILVTGAAGFIGIRVVDNLLGRGFNNIRCLIRDTTNIPKLERVINNHSGSSRAKIVAGNLLSQDDCIKYTQDVAVIYHLAAGTGTKAFSDAYLNSVVTIRNLLEASLKHGDLRRFVNMSSFAVYTNRKNPR